MAVTDAPALAWIQPDPDSDDVRRQFVVIGIRAGGNDGERVVQEVMLGAYQADEDTHAVLPHDLACEITPMEGAVTVPHPEGLAELAPSVVVIDFEHGDRPEDVLAAVRDGETAYTLVGPSTAAAP